MVAIIKITTWENVLSLMCAQRRLTSVCASEQYNQSHRCPHEETLHPWLSKTCPVMILCECAGWSESSLGAHDWRYVFWRCDTYRIAWGKIGVSEVAPTYKGICLYSDMNRDIAFPTRLHMRLAKTDQPARPRSLTSLWRTLYWQTRIQIVFRRTAK